MGTEHLGRQRRCEISRTCFRLEALQVLGLPKPEPGKCSSSSKSRSSSSGSRSRAVAPVALVGAAVQ